MKDVDASLDLLMKISKLKTLRRAGWVERGVPEPESVADHIFMTALIAMFVADEEEMDTGKVLKMVLLHDLQEADCGDITPASELFCRKEELEREAITKLLEDTPAHYLDLWEEYMANVSAEARLAHQADRFEMLLQAFSYEREGNDVKGFFNIDYQLSGALGELEKEVRARRDK